MHTAATFFSLTLWPKGHLEKIELLEQLRLVERGITIQMVEAKHLFIAIDIQEDLDISRLFLINKSSNY
jgi:3-deoxy-manno-octulosonate cytidylyltransferase (CMP-KDO synthetase)